jgi:histidinol-phosphate/aromatic aminotransferase/cobyric acid decarboxylase-like protein
MLRKEDRVAFPRRSFVKTLGLGGISFLAARREASAALTQMAAPAAPRPLLLHNNENPLGPGPAALDALRAALGDGEPNGRYSFRRVKELH